MKRLILYSILALLTACGADDAQAPPDAGPCTCAFALCRADGTCWCGTDAGTHEACEPTGGP